MGAKWKSSENGWGACKQCRCHLSPADVRKHEASCHGSGAARNSSDSPSLQSPLGVTQRDKYGFVRNEILHGFARERPRKVELVSKLSRILPVNFTLLHPSLMKLCQVGIGSLISVWINKDKFVFQTAFPWKDSAQTDVGLSAEALRLLECSTGDVVHIERVRDTEQTPAAELVFKEKKGNPIYNIDDVASYFMDTFDGKLVTMGLSVFINYYGQEYELIVTEIRCGTDIDLTMKFVCDNETVSASNSLWSESDVCESFSKLSVSKLDSLGAPGKTDIVTSTPKQKENVVLCNCENFRPELSGAVSYIHTKTKVRFSECANVLQETEEPNVDRVSFEDIGGLKRQIEEIKQFLFRPKDAYQFFSSVGLKIPRGILLFGPPGTGKTMIGRAVANAMQQNFVLINGPELFSKFCGETEAKLRNIFNEAKARAPCIIFIDDIDCLCPKRGGSTTIQQRRVVATLLTLMDNLPTDYENRVLILAATNQVDALDPAMRRPGRLDLEVETGIPTSLDRLEILKIILKNMSHTLSDSDIEEIARKAHAFVGADLDALCSKACNIAVKRIKTQAGHDSSKSHENMSGKPFTISINYLDMVQAAKKIKPSGLREVQLEIPNVRWEDVGGQEDLKLKLKQAVEWPLKHPEAFKRVGMDPPKGILMFGPPGCSKTLIAKALATESGLNFIAIKGPELFNKYVGESERAAREVFRKARAVAPSILFFDEIDALTAERGSSPGSSNVGDRVLTQLLTEMDGLEKLNGVTIIAASNRPDMIDKALLRPGRLGRSIYVSLPNAKTRHAIFCIQFHRTPVADDVRVSILVERTEGFSGAEIVGLVHEAFFEAFEECLHAGVELEQLSERYFLHALNVVRPRTSQETIKFYDSYCKKGKIGHGQK